MAKKILVVDDEADTLNFTSMRLEAAGYEVRTALNHIQAFELVKEFTPDLVLLDVMMPGKNGYEVCNELKCNEETKHIPVILFTAKPQQKEKVGNNAAFVNADDYLIKPYEPEELLGKIKKFIG